MSKPVVILDIDNCIANDAWRIPLIEWDKEGDERYHRYHASAYYDANDTDWLRGLLQRKQMASSDTRFFFFTARPLAYRELTWKWLQDHLGFDDMTLVMRNTNDHRHAPEVKSSQLDSILQHDGVKMEEIVFAADDREDVLAMYRERGLKMVVRHAIHEDAVWEKPRPKRRSVSMILSEAAKTYAERNAVYGDNFRMVGPLMKVLFPEGVPAALLHSDQFHLFELKLVKLSRFAVSGLTHMDSIHDDGVYSAMIESILSEKECKS